MAKIPAVELSTLEKIAPSELRLLWVNDWYDGPLEAVVELDGEQCLMVLHDEDRASDRPYHWIIIRLSDAQRADEAQWHELFVRHVGDHWCFHDVTIPHPTVPPNEQPDPDKFYVPYRDREELDLRNNAVLGWADEMPAR